MYCIFGAQVEQVDEPVYSHQAVVTFEFEAYPEAKALTPDQLRVLYQRYKSFYRVGDAIGTSEGFARQNAAKPGGRQRKGRRKQS